MTKFLFLALLLTLLSITSLAQAPTPVISPTTSVTSTQVSPSPSPSPAEQSKPDITVVKVGRNGIEVSTSRTWIIVVLIALTIVGGIVYVILKSRSYRETEKSKVVSVFVLLFFTAAVFMIGKWWGEGSARSQVQQFVSANQLMIPQDKISQPTATPTPQPTPESQPVPQTNQTVQTGAGTSWPLHVVIMGFALLVGLEVALYFYLYLRWRWYSAHFYERDRYGWDRHEYWDRFVARSFDSIEQQLADVRSALSKLSSS